MKRIVLSIFVTLFAIATQAADVSFSVLLSKQRVAVGEKFPVTFRLKNGEGTGLKVPQINGCTLIYGPSTSTSQSYQVINGQMSSSSTIDYTYYYRADKEGSYTIGEASIVVDGKKYTSKPATLTVVPGNAQSQGQSSRQQQVDIDDIYTQSSSKSVSANDVFVRIILSISTAYEQEAIDCTIKLYTKYSISSFIPTKQPSFDGFLIEELNIQPQLNEVEEVNGQRYMTALLKKCIIFPQKSGKLTINSGNYDIKVVQYDQVNMGFFSVQNPQERSIKVSSNSATIDIKPLPQPQPEGFTGAVGTFTVDSHLVGNSFRTNDPATLIYTISGTGNIKYIKEPVIDFPSEFEQYTPKSDISAHVAGNNVTGKMTIEYTFVPQAVGDFKIGSDKFVYFDLASKQYVTLTTPAYDIKVAKGVSNQITDADRQDIAAKNTDILHIRLGDKHLKQDHTPLAHKNIYWILYGVILLAFIGQLVAWRRKAKLASDVVGMKHAKANKVARRRLRVAHSYMTQHKSDLFYEELLRAMWGYLSDKLSIPASQLSRDNISSELAQAGAQEDICKNVIDILDECEMARYAPVQSQEQVDKIYETAVQTINSLEAIKVKR